VNVSVEIHVGFWRQHMPKTLERLEFMETWYAANAVDAREKSLSTCPA
jgi:hypothetical protein